MCRGYKLMCILARPSLSMWATLSLHIRLADLPCIALKMADELGTQHARLHAAKLLYLVVFRTQVSVTHECYLL
jgi:hypothetical protein